MAVDVLASRIGASFKSHKSHALVAEGRIGVGTATTAKVILAKPLSFMNASGGPVSSLMKFYDVPLDHLIVLHDELDIYAATLRIKLGGGHGGHNGLRDIIAACGGPDYARVRIGIGRPPGRTDAADYVLKDFSGPERKELPTTLELAADAAEAIVLEGVAAAQQRFN